MYAIFIIRSGIAANFKHHLAAKQVYYNAFVLIIVTVLNKIDEKKVVIDY